METILIFIYFFVLCLIFTFPHAQLVLSQLILNSFRLLVGYIELVFKLHFKILRSKF
jgi:hypothetical protein